MKLNDIARRLKLELRGDGEIEISGPAPIESAAPGTIVFATGPKYAAALATTRAAAAIVTAELAARAHCALLVSRDPAFDFARLMELFHPPYRPAPGIDPSAKIADDARISAGASIGAFSVIGSSVTIGRNAIIHPHVTIYPGAAIGDDFICHSQVSIREHVTIGNRVTVLNGAVIGADGFGFIQQGDDLVKVPQVGTVIIEDDVEIGANTAIDRATMGATVIHRGVKLDNLVHIGHNCEVGEYSRFAAQSGLAGSTHIGKWCQFGGQTGCADHAKIGDRVMVVAQSGIPHDVADDSVIGGTPAMDIRAWRRSSALQPRLPEMIRRIRALEARIGIRAASKDG
ncbi:MAG TPA: UDP-3-O-(3-hydroxymyristoyl)glucosamine N-acyltransferase [Candidatus Binataceae bacterium]|nr:UDP-3-O-(3-hydroxymyristoyl)glucosamine N-acyltransferase [Candidatus Binataceae bacterium]